MLLAVCEGIREEEMYIIFTGLCAYWSLGVDISPIFPVDGINGQKCLLTLRHTWVLRPMLGTDRGSDIFLC
jgi:hypothetical protein